MRLCGANCKALGLPVRETIVIDANSYPQVNPNEKRITDLMKVNVPQHIFVRPSRSHLDSVVPEIKEGLSGQPHELLYYCSCFSCRPWELRCSEEWSRMVSVYHRRLGRGWSECRGVGIWEATATEAE